MPQFGGRNNGVSATFDDEKPSDLQGRHCFAESIGIIWHAACYIKSRKCGGTDNPQVVVWPDLRLFLAFSAIVMILKNSEGFLLVGKTIAQFLGPVKLRKFFIGLSLGESDSEINAVPLFRNGLEQN